MPTAITWGLEASPFLLKLEAMLRFAELPFRRLPGNGSWLENLRIGGRLERAKRDGRVLRHPRMDRALDEYPAVPFFSEDGSTFQYDSTSLGHWLDERSDATHPALFPTDARLGFVARLIDEAFDEFGLYMVHHMRWVGSATDTTMGERTADELSKLAPPLLRALPAAVIRTRIPRRQVRRCPYLFSVAPDGYVAAVEPLRVPPSHAGFPPTHELLHDAWVAYLAAMESLLAAQPFLLGERFTIADASAYGQLSMNLIDPSAARELRDRAPRLFRWLEGIRDGAHVGSRGALFPSDALRPLLAIIQQTFAPLMLQNERAWRSATARGETQFNEAAFDQGRALYDGDLLGRPFRAVVKTFQVRVWHEVRGAWRALSDEDRAALRGLFEPGELFD
jgi:glutathione S-transferase